MSKAAAAAAGKITDPAFAGEKGLPEKEEGTIEEGVKEDPAREEELGPKIFPELNFLEDEDGNVFIGRKKGLFEKYGTEGTIFIGKQYIKMGDIMSLANKVLLDVVRPHVILVAGKRGEGKSYTLAQIAEGMAFFLPKEISQNIALLFLDTMGIFWTMKFPNYRDEALLHNPLTPFSGSHYQGDRHA